MVLTPVVALNFVYTFVERASFYWNRGQMSRAAKGEYKAPRSRQNPAIVALSNGAFCRTLLPARDFEESVAMGSRELQDRPFS
jgi:hypothetical protein